MELESCKNLTHTQNVFNSHPTIHKTNAFCSHANKYNMLQKQIKHVLHIQRNIFLQVQKNILQIQTKIFQLQKNILQVQKTSMKKKLSRDFWHYFSALLIHTQMSSDPHTNASKLSNKCPVIRTPPQQVALMRQFRFFFLPKFLFYSRPQQDLP